MSYFINTVRHCTIKVNGQDVTDRVTEITLSDSSGVRNGLIATDGEMTLAYRPGSTPREDYERILYKRGTRITIDVTFPSGNTLRHPRGLLYVLDSAFNPEDETITLSVGCRMAFAALDGDASNLLNLGRLYLPETREDYSSVSQQLATEGRIAWYDSNGSLRTADLFKGSNSPRWVSVFGLTAVAVAPLDQGRSIQEQSNSKDEAGNPYTGADPDNITLEYEYANGVIDEDGNLVPDEPEGDGGEVPSYEADWEFDPENPSPPPPLAPNGEGKPITKEMTYVRSRFFSQYPAIFYERKPEDPDENGNPDLDKAGDPEDDEGLGQQRPNECLDGSDLGETSNPAGAPSNPGGGDGNGDTNCMDAYQTVRTPLYVGVQTWSFTKTYYLGPANQKSFVKTENYGPAMDANSQYYGDLFQICRQGWATRCNPNGFCGTEEGERLVLLNYNTITTEFNEDGSVSREITDVYETRLSAARTQDWRAGIEEGRIIGFRTIERPFDMYRSKRTIVFYFYPKRGTKRETVQYVSISSRGNGLGQNDAELDALNGIPTVTTERSTNNGLNAPLPPMTSTPEPPTQSQETEVIFGSGEGGGDGGGVNGDGNLEKGLTYNENVPFPILIPEGSDLTVESVVSNYEDYIKTALKGQSQGLRIGESLREEMVTNWTPNIPFRYSDPRYNTLMALRGDAHTWTITPTSCTMTVDGLTIGFSNGTVNVPDNVVGVRTAVL